MFTTSSRRCLQSHVGVLLHWHVVTVKGSSVTPYLIGSLTFDDQNIWLYSQSVVDSSTGTQTKPAGEGVLPELLISIPSFLFLGLKCNFCASCPSVLLLLYRWRESWTRGRTRRGRWSTWSGGGVMDQRETPGSLRVTCPPAWSMSTSLTVSILSDREMLRYCDPPAGLSASAARLPRGHPVGRCLLSQLTLTSTVETVTRWNLLSIHFTWLQSQWPSWLLLAPLTPRCLAET